MKSKELFDLQKGLKLSGEITDQPFVFIRLRNKKNVDEIIETLQESNKPTDDYIKYDAERIELCRRNSKINKETNECMISGQNTFVIDEKKQESFNNELSKLISIHNETINNRVIQLKEYDKLLNEEFKDFIIYKVKQKDIPKTLNGDILELLYPMIEFD